MPNERDELDRARDAAAALRGGSATDSERNKPVKGVPLASVVSGHGPFKGERFVDGRDVEHFVLTEDVLVEIGKGTAQGRAGEVVVRYGGDIPDTIMTADCFKQLCGKP